MPLEPSEIIALNNVISNRLVPTGGAQGQLVAKGANGNLWIDLPSNGMGASADATVKRISDFVTGDVGAKINQAVAWLQLVANNPLGYGTIIVDVRGDITTQVLIPKLFTLVFAKGVWRCKVNGVYRYPDGTPTNNPNLGYLWESAIYTDESVTVVGAGFFSSIIYENYTQQTYPMPHKKITSTFASFSTAVVSPNGATGNSKENEFRDIQICGRIGSDVLYQSLYSAISFGNLRKGFAERVYLNGVNQFGITAGATGLFRVKNSTADRIHVERCIFDQCGSQNLNCVNGKNIIFSKNFFSRPSKRFISYFLEDLPINSFDDVNNYVDVPVTNIEAGEYVAFHKLDGSAATLPGGLAFDTPYLISERPFDNVTSTYHKIRLSADHGATILDFTGTGNTPNQIFMYVVPYVYVDGMDASTSRIIQQFHNYDAPDGTIQIQFKQLNKTSTLPAGLSFDTNYWVRNQRENDYQLSLTPTGAIINWTGVPTLIGYINTITHNNGIGEFKVANGTTEASQYGGIMAAGRYTQAIRKASGAGVIDNESNGEDYLENQQITDNIFDLRGAYGATHYTGGTGSVIMIQNVADSERSGTYRISGNTINALDEDAFKDNNGNDIFDVGDERFPRNVAANLFFLTGLADVKVHDNQLKGGSQAGAYFGACRRARFHNNDFIATGRGDIPSVVIENTVDSAFFDNVIKVETDFDYSLRKVGENWGGSNPIMRETGNSTGNRFFNNPGFTIEKRTGSSSVVVPELLTTGDGTHFLADDGTYRTVTSPSSGGANLPRGVILTSAGATAFSSYAPANNSDVFILFANGSTSVSLSSTDMVAGRQITVCKIGADGVNAKILFPAGVDVFSGGYKGAGGGFAANGQGSTLDITIVTATLVVATGGVGSSAGNPWNYTAN